MKSMIHFKAFWFFMLNFMIYAVFVSSSQADEVTRTFRHITPDDGMANAFVWKILQDRHGFIWAAGNSGIDRFDGTTVKSFVHDPLNEHSIPRGRVLTIYEDPSGLIWVGADALALFDPGRESSRNVKLADSIPAPVYIWQILADGHGGVWVAAENGLYHFGEQDLKAGQLMATRYLVSPDESNLNNIMCLSTAGHDKLWVVNTNSIYHFDLNNKEFTDLGPFGGDVGDALKTRPWDALTDSRGHFWLSTFGGLILWRSGSDKPELLKSIGRGAVDLSVGYIQGLSEDSQGNIWIGTGTVGAIRYHPEHETYLVFRANEGDKQSIVEDDIHYVFEDKDGGLWFGYHYAGMSHYSEQRWNYTFFPLRSELDVNHLANRWFLTREDSQGNLWAGTGYGLMQMRADGTDRVFYIPKPDVPMTNTPAIFPNAVSNFSIHDNKIILITYTNTIYVFNTLTKQFEQLIADFEGDLFTDIAEDDQYYYAGSFNAGMIMLDKSDYTTIVISNILNDPESSQDNGLIPYVDVDKNVWVLSITMEAVTYDFYKFDPDNRMFSEKLHSGPDNLTDFSLPIMSSSMPGLFWSIHSAGLVKLDVINGRNEWYLRSQAQSFGNRGLGLLEYADGQFWTGHDGGMIKLDLAAGNVSTYPGDPSRRPGMYVLPRKIGEGDIIFGGSGGAVRFNPDALLEETPLDMVHITELRAGGQLFRPLYEEGMEYRLSHTENNLNISYIAINYRNSASTRYRYRLAGHSDEWTEVGNQQSIFLANLSPGRYVFQLQASTPSSGYTGKTAEVSIRIMPPWWRTIPAMIVFGILLIMALVGFDRMQRQRLIARERDKTRERELAQAKEIEKAYVELKATQSQLIQAEKMASLGELTAGIAHEIQNPLNFVNNFSELNKELISELREEMGKGKLKDAGLILADIEGNEDKIIFHGKRADSIVKGMLLHSRSNNGQKEPTDINALADEYLRLAYHGLRARDKSFNANFSLEADPDLPKIKVVPQDMGRVLLNLINNAFQAVLEKQETFSVEKIHEFSLPKYTPTVTVSTKNLGDRIEIAVKDNGPGIPENVKEKIFQPFFTTKPAGHGTGLGLSITYDIVVKGHNGTIDIESEMGKGTVFLVRIPVG